MTAFKFLHGADLHLDSPLLGLEHKPGAPADELRRATRRALSNLVDVAIEEQVAFVVLAGDLYDGTWRDYQTGIYFGTQMLRLKEHEIRVFMVSGNHDAENHMTRALRPPDNVVQFSTKRAETYRLDELGVAVHGRGYPSRDPGEGFVNSYPTGLGELFNIGVLHTSLDGREGYNPYAPCSIDDLRSRHYQYWALGHVHNRETVIDDPWVVFPGNTQGRHVRETGPKGCVIVSVEGTKVTEVRDVSLDVVRWHHAIVDVTGLRSTDLVLARILAQLESEAAAADGRLVAARVELRGATATHAELWGRVEHWVAQLRADLPDRIWLEKLVLRTAAEQEMELGPMEELLSNRDNDAELIAELALELVSLRAKLPRELLAPPEALDPTDPDVLRGALDAARDLLRGRLGGMT